MTGVSVRRELGCGQIPGLAYVTRPRLCRYSQGPIFPNDVLILIVLYYIRYSFNPSQAAWLGEYPFLDMGRSRPAFSIRFIQPDHY